MVGKSKLIYIVGSVIIGIIALLIIMLGLVAGGVLSGSAENIIISSASEEFVYDGNSHTSGGWKLEQGELKKGHTAQVKVSGSQTNVGTSENRVSATIVDENGADVTAGYTIEYLPGKLTVTPRLITISTSSATKVYDGAPLTANGADDFTITDGELVAGDEITVVNNTSITDAGTIGNKLSNVYVKNASGRDKSGNYEFIQEAGVLEVKPRRISIEAGSATKIYDGTPLTFRKLKGITSGETLIQGHTVTGFEIPSEITDVGSCENYIAGVTISDSDGKDVTYNYELDLHSGRLIVTPRPISVRSRTKSGKYTGDKLTCDQFDIVSEYKLAEGHSINVAISGERTEVGESPNYIAEVIVTDADGNDVTSNYDITKVPGALIVMSAEGQSPEGGGLDGSGNIDGGDLDTPEQLALKVRSSIDGRIYLKYKSFGAYNLHGWNEASAYSHLLDGVYSADYLAGIALKNAGYTGNTISIDVQGTYFLPYYMEMSPSDYVVQASDVEYTGDGKTPYSLYYYSYNYVADGEITANLGAYSAYERSYHEYVKNNYLYYPESTKNTLLEILSKFDPSDPDLIEKVAKYVQTAAKYDLEYDRSLDECADVAVAFLTEYKTGICQHYASSATLLYRMLGIPARYTVGFAGETKAGEWVNLTSKDAHAWVEVYVAGTGWVNVEVTGSDNNGSGGGGGGGQGDESGEGGGGGGGSGTGAQGQPITVKPATEYYEYNADGVTAYRHSGKLQGVATLDKAGYTYEYTVSDETRTSPGKTKITITSFKLFDSTGNDITDTVNLKFGTGYLCVYMWSLNIETEDEEKQYDGTPFVPQTEPEITFENSFGHEVHYTLKTSLTDVGVKDHAYEITVTDETGADVTDMYKINTSYGKLSVVHRKITVTADSAQKPFDGEPLTAQSFKITEGELAEGDRIEVVVKGTQTKLGESANKIISVMIIDSDGNDVSQNYAITTVNGLLQITPPV